MRNFDILCRKNCGWNRKTYNKINYEPWNGLKIYKYNPKEPVIKGEMNMRKRKWYERMSAAVLIAVLLVNHGDMGIMAKAETITALEENLEEENKKIEAETASASNADEKRDTTVDSNETTLRRRPRQHRMGKRTRRRREKWLSVR
jgi:hypothetical protein